MDERRGRVSQFRNRIAVFIDGDNISEARLSFVFNYLQPNWNPHIRRIYGVGLAGKRAWFQPHGVDPHEVTPNVRGKNAADIALAVDAMEQLFLGIADAFAIVGSDSDYTLLVSRIRERGKTVLVFGAEDTRMALKNACDEFVVFDPPKPKENEPVSKSGSKGAPKATPKAAPKPKPQPAPKPKPAEKPAPAINPASKIKPSKRSLPVGDALVSELHRLFKVLIDRSIEPTLRALEKQFHEEYPHFSPNKYWDRSSKTGVKTQVMNFTDLIRKSKVFDLSGIHGTAGETKDYRLALRKTVP